MSLKSSAARYGAVAVALHWVTALLVVVMLVSGLRAAGTDDDAVKTALLRLHAPAGIALFVLTLLRVLWWWKADTKPAPVAGSPRWQERIARAVHVLFYLALFSMSGSGIVLLLLSGVGDVLFAGAPGPLPDFYDYLPRRPHRAMSRLLMGLVVLHAAAALYHQFVRRDGLLGRMWFRRS